MEIDEARHHEETVEGAAPLLGPRRLDGCDPPASDHERLVGSPPGAGLDQVGVGDSKLALSGQFCVRNRCDERSDGAGREEQHPERYG